jgi:hypothetical protein
MDSALEHNQSLQANGMFTAADLEENKRGQYSASQLERFQSSRDFMKHQANKYDNSGLWVSAIFAVGFIIFSVVLYFVGVFDLLQKTLGGLFLTVMAGLFILVVLLIFVVIPKQYRDSVKMAKAMGTPLTQSPLGNIQVIEARAEVYKSQSGESLRGGRLRNVAHVLQMEGIKFLITSSLRETIQNKRLYRVYAVQDQGAWVLLSMETLE